MTRTTNARIAGFTYLFYAAIGVCSEMLMHQVRGVDGDAAMLVQRFANSHERSRRAPPSRTIGFRTRSPELTTW